MKHCLFSFLVITSITIGPGCITRKIQTESIVGSQWTNIDYSLLNNWAAHPDKKDESDTIVPIGTRVIEKNVDVFYVHPTTLTGKIRNGYVNGSLEDDKLNKKTDQSAIRFQASTFNVGTRIFAPRYRQAHIKMYQEADTVRRNNIFNVAYNDVKSAFVYYLKNLNQGRPFILASHSQGTTHTKRLIKEMIDETSLKDKLIAAYLIGMPIMKNEFTHIPMCKDSSDINCFVSWRTFRNDYEDSWANRMDTIIAVVNPVTWQTTDEIASKSQHKGAVLYNLNKVYSGIHETQAQGSGLWITKPKFPGSFLYTSKNYHIGDINLFYVDIRNNVIRRIEEYEKNHTFK